MKFLIYGSDERLDDTFSFKILAAVEAASRVDSLDLTFGKDACAVYGEIDRVVLYYELSKPEVLLCVVRDKTKTRRNNK